MPIVLLWLQLAAIAAVILAASQFMVKSVDIISEKTGLSRSFVGIVLLATATSLPEVGTGLSSILVVGVPDLAVGTAFGSNVFNLLIISLLDLYWRNGPILNAVTRTSVLVASLGIGVISLASVAVFVHGATSTLSGWYLSPFSVVILIFFIGAMFLIYRHDRVQAVSGEDPPLAPRLYEESSLSKAAMLYVVSAAVVVVAAVWLSKTGDSIAEEMGWEASFVGTQFLALSTSLPELSTSIGAVRLNAPDLALSNVLGSNLFNMGFVLFLDDLAYTDGALWGGISQVHLLTGVIAVFMTGVVIVALLARPRRRLSRFWTVEGMALLALYIAAAILVFKLA